MSGPEASGPRPGDYDGLGLAELAARYVALDLSDSGLLPGTQVAGRALEQLALGAAIAGRVSACWALDAATAIRAGASWEQVARARGRHDPAAVRAEFAAWVRGQARLHRDTGLGLDDRQAHSAWELLHGPGPCGPDVTRSVDGPAR